MKALIKSCLVLLATGLTGLTVAPVEAQGKSVPRGPYTHSCSQAYVHMGRLYADCRDQRGQVRATSILMAPCSNTNIDNENGLLVCGRHRGDFERPGGGPPTYPSHPGNPGYPGYPGHSGQPGRPGGGWGSSRSIMVFEHADFRGRSLEIEGEISNLKEVGMNDRISSVATRGRWEVCTDAGFRGNCMIIDGDISNMKDVRMNDSISSMRPIRGRRR